MTEWTLEELAKYTGAQIKKTERRKKLVTRRLGQKT